MATIPLINGREYGWGDVSLTLFSRKILGITDIKYEDHQEVQTHYGAGNFPVSYGTGKVAYKGAIKLQMQEILAIQEALPTGSRLQDIDPFPISVTYSIDGISHITDLLSGCKFMANGRDVKQGDTIVEKEFELMIGFIQFGIK